MQVRLAENTVFTTGVLRAKSVAGRMSVPVKPALTLYARYKHVQGVPSDDPSGGVPLSRIRVLNHLIDRLVQLKDDDSLKTSAPDPGKLSDEALDAMIEDVSNKLQVAMKQQAPQLAGATAAMGLQSGALVSLTA